MANLFVRTGNAAATRGHLSLGGQHFACALGRSGVTARKCEGDGATPIGTMALRRIYFRPDRLSRPATALPARPLDPALGWCDDPRSPRYNKLISLPFSAQHEYLWRADHLYDVVVELGYNDAPPIRWRGSAIFLHIAKPDYAPTAGCVALARRDMLRLLPRLAPGDTLTVVPPWGGRAAYARG